MPNSWQPASTIPKDGTPFIFRERHPGTYKISPYMIGRYNEGALEVYTGSRWRAWPGKATQWAEIPGATPDDA